MKIDKIDYSHYGECVIISNDTVEVLVTTQLGPRIIAYRFINGENILGELTDADVVPTEWGEWHPWGGHRLWHSPEAKPRSYVPDNDPVKVDIVGGDTVIVNAPFEYQTGIQKEMIIKLASNGTKLEVIHKLTNKGVWTIKLAPWALTIMKGGGTTICPQEPFIPHTGELLPARPLTMWHYTDFTDSRWTLGKKYILLKSDDTLDFAQKVGAANKQGWAGYLLDKQLFIKRFAYVDGEEYPDYGCNFETYTCGSFMEVETVGYLSTLKPGDSAVHTEYWYLFNDVECDLSEDSIDKSILPLLELTESL
ncbi:MAG: hypothetical protein SNJ70_00160 [Armatimonadota bacterium]